MAHSSEKQPIPKNGQLSDNLWAVSDRIIRRNDAAPSVGLKTDLLLATCKDWKAGK